VLAATKVGQHRVAVGSSGSSGKFRWGRADLMLRLRAAAPSVATRVTCPAAGEPGYGDCVSGRSSALGRKAPCDGATGHWRAINPGVAGSMTVTGGASAAQVRAVRDPDLSDSQADGAGFDCRHPLPSPAPASASRSVPRGSGGPQTVGQFPTADLVRAPGA